MLSTPRLRPFVGREEALVLEAYPEPDGKLAIGFGHHGGAAVPGQTITTQEAIDLMNADLRVIEIVLSRALSVDLLPHEFDALCDLAYQHGNGAIARSPLVAALNTGSRDVGDYFLSYEHPGRRQRELTLFRTGDYGDISTILFFATNPHVLPPPTPERIPWPGGTP